MDRRLPVTFLLCVALAGCGTTKWTNTSRSATEQLLISDAMDRAVSQIDFRALAGKKVYLDAKATQSATDSAYLISLLRQHMLASGCLLMDSQAEADYVVEARSGAVGTDHHELVYGVPRVDVPALIPISGVGVPPNIPELKFVTRTDQRAVVKIAVFAYNRETGRPVWQSGVVPAQSDAKAFWVFGAGPFQTGSIYQGTAFAGRKLNIPLIDPENPQDKADAVSVADEAYFIEPAKGVAQKAEASEAGGGSTAAVPGEDAKPTQDAAGVVQTAHAPSGAKADKAPPPEQPVGEPPNSGPPQPSSAATPPSGPAPTETNPAEVIVSDPPAAAPPSPATILPAESETQEPAIQAPATALWPESLLPPLPPVLNPFD